MDRLSAPEQNRLLAGLSNLLRRVEQDSGPEFLPRGLDVMGLVRQLALPSAETVEKLSYGDPLFRMPTQSNIPITTDRGYVAEVLGMAPVVPAASRATTRISNEMADQLVRAITGNPQATAPAALEAAGQMLPIANMVKPGLSWQGKKIPDVDKLAKQSDKFLYHSDTAENIENLQYGIEPQQGGPWVREIAEGAVDDVDELLERSTPLSWFSDDPTWVKIKVSRKLGKPLSEVTVDDIREHGHLALINKKDPNLTDIYRVGEEGLGQGPYSKVKTIGGSEVKAYETPIYQDGMEPFGVERSEWIATQDVEPFVQLTGDDLVKFMRIKGLLEPEAATSKKTALSDTKVVDDSGNPMVMYHGTQRAPTGIDEFGSESGYAGQETAGISWFTSSPESASGYANWVEGAGNPTVYPVYLSIKNPASINDYLKAVDEINKSVKGRNFVDADPEIGMYDKRVVEKLKDKGFDGVSWTDAEYTGQTGFATDKDVTALPFSSKQIKSAISDPSFAGLLDE